MIENGPSMQSLETLWRAASSVQFETTRAHWQQMLGDSLGDFEHLLLATDELGSHIPKPGCKWTWYPVEEHDHATVIAFDEETGGLHKFPKRDASVMRVNWRLVYRSLCESMGVELNERTVDGSKHLWQIGCIRPATGVELPVFHSKFPVDDAITQLVALRSEPFVMLHSAKNRVNTTAELLLRSSQSIEMSLLHFTELDSCGKVVLANAGMERTKQFRVQNTPTRSTTEPSHSFHPPADATWSQVHIRFLDGDNIRVSVLGQTMNFHYGRLGMANSRNATPTKQWLLLRKFAADGGVITWRDSGAAANVKKQTQELNQKLLAGIAIGGQPIEYDKAIKGYRTAFQIEDC